MWQRRSFAAVPAVVAERYDVLVDARRPGRRNRFPRRRARGDATWPDRRFWHPARDRRPGPDHRLGLFSPPEPAGVAAGKADSSGGLAHDAAAVQSAARQYNIGERQLRRAMKRAVRRPGRTLLSDLETRLDDVMLHAGFAPTIYQARQAITHGHIQVDGRRVDKPTYRLRPGQVIEVAKRSKGKTPFLIAATGEYAAEHPPFLQVEKDPLRARLVRWPTRPEIPVICDEQLLVEYYTR
jgi:small subunit ribosomal protein S4